MYNPWLMQKHTYFLSILLTTFICLSCDTNDDTNNMIDSFEDDIIFQDTYFSLFVDDTWRYTVTLDAMPATRDTLTSVNDPNAPVGFAKLEASPTSTGFMTGLLGNGFIEDLNTKLIYQGSLDLPVDPDNPIQINIPEAIVYDIDMPSGSILSTVEQTVTQDVNGFPLTIDVVATTRQLDLVENYTVNGQNFESAVQSSIVVTATISTELLGIPIILLAPQEVLVVENTFGFNVGLIASTTTLDYEFVDLTPFGITLPFPPTATAVSVQEIESYEVARDD